MSLSVPGDPQPNNDRLGKTQAAQESSQDRVQARIDLLRSHIIEPYLRDLELLGQFEKREEQQSAMLLAVQSFQDALQRYERGEKFEQIAAALGTTPSRVKGWLVDGRLPDAISRIDRDSRKVKSFAVRIPHEKSTSFAYLLGVFCGNVDPGHSIYYFRPTVRNQVVAETLGNAFEQVVDSRAKIRPRTRELKEATWQGYEVNCLSLPLSRHLNLVTRSNQRVPWEHLGTDEERRSFLRGLFDICSWVNLAKSGGIGLQRTNGSYLIVEIAHLLAQVGIVPRIRMEGKPLLAINELADLRKFEAIIGFTDPEQQARLRELTSRTVTRVAYRQEDYVRARSVWEANPGATVKELAASAGVSEDAIKSWRNRGQVPQEVTRLRLLEELLHGHERDIDLLALLFRDFNLSVAQCQHVAASHTKERVLQIETFMRSALLEPKKNPDLFVNLISDSSICAGSIKETDRREGPRAAEPPIRAPSREHEDDPLTDIRKRAQRGEYQSLYFFEALCDLAGRASKLSYPTWTFEKFVGGLNESDRGLARRLLVVFTDSATAQLYQAFLVEQHIEAQ
jgi:hypothetical protein